eukprot:s402_g21.t1
MDFIPDSEISALATHKFQSAGYTWLDEKMDPFWSSVAQRIPRYISPNLISVLGGFCCALAAVFTVLANHIRWIPLYFVGPFLIFVYMTCDAVDGKHARQTKQSTPLGAVVDHGIDAFCAFTTGIAVVVTADPELKDPRLMLAFCLFHGSWFCAQWGELVLGSLDQRGITEGEFASMAVIALPGIFGPDAAKSRMPAWVPYFGDQPILDPVMIGVILVCGGVCLSFALRIFLKVQGLDRLKATFPLVHLAVHTSAAMQLATSPLRPQFPLLTFTVVGMNAALLMTKMRFMATFRVPWPALHWETLPFLAGSGVEALGFMIGAGGWLLIALVELALLLVMWDRLLRRICSSLKVPFLGEVLAEGREVQEETFALGALAISSPRLRAYPFHAGELDQLPPLGRGWGSDFCCFAPAEIRRVTLWFATEFSVEDL